MRHAISALLAASAVLSTPRVGAAEPPTAGRPDPPPRTMAPRAATAGFPPSWSLDGLYLWLGPTGAASRVSGAWDSTIGGQAAMVRVAEACPIAALGVGLGASRWTERGGGRVWLDVIAGTRAVGPMLGVSVGPIIELSDIQHPRLGGTVGIWVFLGITPYARAGWVQELGGFAELGVHLVLPVYRR